MTLSVLSLSSSLGKAEISSQSSQALYFYGKSEASERGLEADMQISLSS